jgi:hypothetical protein
MSARGLLALFAAMWTLCSCGSGGEASDSVPDAAGGQEESDPEAGGSSGSSGNGGSGGSSGIASAASSSGGGSSGSGSGSASSGSGSGGAASDSSSGVTSSGSSSSSSSSGGAPDSGGTAVTGPCDIYAAGGTPCVAAHSTVRALYGAYRGSLYQVRRTSDTTTKDIGVLASGGFADAAAQDAFCAGTTCTIAVIYDQSMKGNHLRSASAGGAKKTPDNEANASALKLTISGHNVYGVHIPAGTGYRNDATSSIATGDEPETEYMGTSGTYYNGGCCFDYGNAETNNKDDGAGTMEAVYFGNSTTWGKGAGSGPWVMADLENGLFGGQSTAANLTNTPLTSSYVTVMVKGRSGSFGLKGGNAQSGKLTTMYDGARPAGYNPMKKQGAIILGIGGDNSNGAQGNFFEGVMTSGNASDSADDAVQANIVDAGYGH